MTASALDDVLVLDLTAAVSGAGAGKLLADLGARVVIVEPDGGSAFRAHGLFDYFSGGKESLVPADAAELGAVAGRRRRRADRRLVAVARRRRRRSRRRHRARRPVAVRPVGPVRRVGQQRPRHVGDGRLPVLHGLARPRADLGARPAGPAARRLPRRAGRARRSARARAQRARPARRGRRPRRRARRPRLAGVVVGGQRAAPRAPAQRPHPGRRRLGLRDAHRPQGRAVHHDRPARPPRRGLHGRRPDVERQHPADLRGRRRVGARTRRSPRSSSSASCCGWR